MSQWFDMGGYGLYVWGSMGCTAVVLAWNLLAPWLARRQLLTALRDAAEDDETGFEEET